MYINSRPTHRNQSKKWIGCILFICGIIALKIFVASTINYFTSSSDLKLDVIDENTITLNAIDIENDLGQIVNQHTLNSKLKNIRTKPVHQEKENDSIDPVSVDAAQQPKESGIVEQTNNIVELAPIKSANEKNLEHQTTVDTKKLIDLNNFEYLIDQPSCAEYERSRANETSVPLLTVILVHTAPNNTAKREAVRETWGKKDPRSRLFFLMGAVDSIPLQNKLIEENNQFHDLIQGNFMDTYHNLTYKHVMVLKWFNDKCPKVKFLFKTDDDTFVGIDSIYSLMETELKQSDKLLVCHQWNNGQVHRKYSKWTVNKNEFADNFYPSYCAGYAIIYTNDVVPRLLCEAFKSHFFWIDDVHVSGILRSRLKNVFIKSFEDFYYYDNEKTNDLLEGKIHIDDIKPRYLFIEADLEIDAMRKLWNMNEKQLA